MYSQLIQFGPPWCCSCNFAPSENYTYFTAITVEAQISSKGHDFQVQIDSETSFNTGT